MLGPMGSRLCLIVFNGVQSLVEGFVFLGLVHCRIAVPLVHVHRNKVPRSEIESDAKLGEQCFPAVVLASLQDRQIPISVLEIPCILVEGCSKITIYCDRRKSSIVDLIGRSGMNPLILFLMGLGHKVLELLVNGFNEGQTLFVVLEEVLRIGR